MPTIVGNHDDSDRPDDSDHGSDFGSMMSEEVSFPSSFFSEADRVVTPFAPFHPEIPLVRTRVLEELTERMPVPYPSEPFSCRGSGARRAMTAPYPSESLSRHGTDARKAAVHRKSDFDSCYTHKTTTHYSPSNEGRVQRVGSPCYRNVDAKIVLRHDKGNLGCLLGRCDGETDRFHNDEDDMRMEGRVGPDSSSLSRHQREDSFSEKGLVPLRKSPKPRDDALDDRVYCDEIGEFDVCLGRGPNRYSHEGNKHFHDLKQQMQPQYLEAPKEGKIGISQSLVDAIHAIGGRFLKYDEAKSMWYEVLNRVAREKAAQALRETFTKEERQKKRLKYKKAANKIHHDAFGVG